MDFWSGFIVVTIAHLLAAASPGPDFALVTRQALRHGRKAAIWTSLGISLGLSIHLLYSTAGLAAVVVHSAQGMILIKLLGGGYLLFLGVKGLWAKPAVTEALASEAGEVRGTGFRHLLTGFFCNVLNPKAPIYFLALFTVILSPDMPPGILAVYGVWIMFLQMAWFTLLSVLLANPRLRHYLLKRGHWVDRIFGATMLALGIRVLKSSS